MRRRVLIATILVFAILLQMFIPFTAVNAATNLEISFNKNLYDALKSQLQAKEISATYNDSDRTISISSQEIAKVKTLDLSNSGIKDLTGLSNFTSVTDLNLTANYLTKDSNLGELNALKLDRLNLSSNKLESVSAIANFDSIPYSDITNQEVVDRKIISVDVSEESNHVKTAEITLPDILLKDTGMIEADWINSVIINASEDYKATVDWTSVQRGSTNLTLNIASGDGKEFKANKGLITVIVSIKDSESKLANTRMTFYYAIVDSDETGIAFNDENLYKAVKAQLTAKQKENPDLSSYDTSETNLYLRAYDSALILVIDTNVLTNQIPSLILNDKRIVDLTGIEEFVGLQTNLNVSFNYIDSIEKIVELEKNKGVKEGNLIQRFSKVLNVITSNVNSYKSAKEQSNSLQEQLDAKAQAIKEVGDGDGSAEKKSTLSNQWNELSKQKTEVDAKVKEYEAIIAEASIRLHAIYNKEYKLTTLLPVEIEKLSLEDLYKADLATVKGYAESIMTKVSGIEQADGLFKHEIKAITELFDIPVERDVPQKDSKGEDTTSKKEPIKNPITEYFNSVKKAQDLATITFYEDFVMKFKYIDVCAKAINYDIIDKKFNSGSSAVVVQALKEMQKEREIAGLDTTIVDEVLKVAENNASSVKFKNTELEKLEDLFKDVNTYRDKVGSDSSVNITFGLRLGKVSQAEMAEYINLPRTRALNIRDNKITTLEGIEELKHLKSLDAFKNILGNVKNVNWQAITTLKDLNVGFNQLSDIKSLEGMTTLENLDVSRNLLGGNFDFYLAGMKKLKSANFAYNQYSNIAYLLNQFAFIAKSHDKTAEEFLISEEAPYISFGFQSLEISATVVRKGATTTIDLPPIFAQFEQIDYARTSFGETSQNGTVLADGTGVVLKTPAIGRYQGIVVVEAENGYADDDYEIGMGFGTTCTINYNVVANATTSNGNTTPTPDNTNPGTTGGQTGGQTGNQQSGSTGSKDINYGYTVSNGYVYVLEPNTTIDTFKNKLTSEDYDVKVIKDNTELNSGKLSTGSVVSIDTVNGEEVEILELVVKGDVNGDCDVDALDSGLTRGVINDTSKLHGVYEDAADVNSDGDIDSLDALLLLQYRADKITSFQK